MTFRTLNAIRLALLVGAALVASTPLGGCETDSYIDPSRTGYFETTPTAIPILNRIDVIEQVSEMPAYSPPSPEDLRVSPIDYILASGDVIKVSIPKLIAANETDVSQRAIDQSGMVTLPIIGRLQAAGLTVEQLQKSIEGKLTRVMTDGKAFIEVVEARAYQFRVLGAVDGPGLYALNKPDLTLLDALALARGASPSTTRVLITRKLSGPTKTKPDGEVVEPQAPTQPAAGESTPTQPPAPKQPEATAPPPPSDVDIDELMNNLRKQNEAVGEAGAKAESTPPATNAPGTTPTPAPDTPNTPSAEPPAASPASEPPSSKPARLGMLAAVNRPPPPVDIDQLEPPSAAPVKDAPVPVAVPAADASPWFQDGTTGQWRRLESGQRSDASAPEGSGIPSDAGSPPPGSLPGLATGERARDRARARIKDEKNAGTRVIEVDYNQLVRGASSLNVIVRQDDVIYCDTGEVGVVYIGGEIARPGVYNLPTSGKLTLSRLVDAAGGLSQIAIPERVDLIRRIGGDKEACVRVNLAAIRNRAEPDIFMRPDDHVIIGTNFWATPLAVIRNGFRMTYGFGFLVDRNWGNDIFGAPPVNVVGQ